MLDDCDLGLYYECEKEQNDIQEQIQTTNSLKDFLFIGEKAFWAFSPAITNEDDSPIKKRKGTECECECEYKLFKTTYHSFLIPVRYLNNASSVVESIDSYSDDED